MILLLASLAGNAQPGNAHKAVVHKPACHRYAWWFLPVARTTTVDGIAMGVYAGAANDKDTLVVNGISIEADPLPVLGGVYFTVFAAAVVISKTPSALVGKHRPKRDTALEAYRRRTGNDTPLYKDKELPEDDTVMKTRINGLSISTGIVARKTKINGLALNVVCGLENALDGVEVTGLLNWHHSFRGLLVAIANTSTKGKGVQIGIYNYCGTGNVLQIGLVNRIGKRTTPLINFRFRRKK